MNKYTEKTRKKTINSHSLTSGFLKFGMKMLLRRGRAMMAVEKPKRAFACKFILKVQDLKGR
jgi:hypothetical protein